MMCGFVTWSDWDLGVCLLYECRRKQFRVPDILNSWIDLRLTYKLFYNRKPKGLNGALQDVGIEFFGREHSGLDDSRNTAKLAWRMICDGCVMKITKSLNKVSPNVSNERPRTFLPEQNHSCRQRDATDSSSTNIGKNDGQSSNRGTISVQSDVTKRHVTVQPLPIEKKKLKKDLQEGAGQLLEIGQLPQTLINGLSTTLCNGNSYKFSTRNSLSCLQSRILAGAFTSIPINYSLHSPCHALISTSVTSVNDFSALDLQPNSDLSVLADWEEAAIINDTTDQSIGSEKWEKQVQLPADSQSHSQLMFKSNLNKWNENTQKKVDDQPQQSNFNCVYTSPNTPIYNRIMKKHVSNKLSFKLPKSSRNKSDTLTTVQTCKLPSTLQYIPKRKLSSVSYSPPRKLPFTIHEDQENLIKKLPETSTSSHMLPRSVLNSTVNLNTSVVRKTVSVTAPMCICGRRTKRLTVSNKAQNHGRVFYTCSGQNKNDKRIGCNYFKWEDTLLKEKSIVSSFTLSASNV